MDEWDAMVVVGRVARPHGLRGDVVVNPETDFAGDRFAPGATMWVRLEGRQRLLTVARARMQTGRPVVVFEGLESRDAAESLAGVELRVPEESLRVLEPGRYYEHQLVGCRVEAVERGHVGTVARVEGGPGVSRLVVESARGEILIPFAQAICVEVDVAARRILVNPPAGLLEVNETGGGG